MPGQVSSGTLPGLPVPLGNRSGSFEFTAVATGAGKPQNWWPCQLQWPLVCLPQQRFGNGTFWAGKYSS